MDPTKYYFGDSSEGVKKELLSHAMEGNWPAVIRIYRNDESAHTVAITRSGDTALHMAISDGQATAVKSLVETVGIQALKIQNEQGNTPLHVAAYLGNARMCRWIAAKDSELVGERNNKRHTPIFVAVLHGRKEAFLCMYKFIRRRSDRGFGYCSNNDGSNNDGRTILHYAISGEHFDLAVQILHLYPIWKLIRNDVDGISPLHLLAAKPSAFKSGTRMGLLQTFVYHCIYIRQLQVYRDADDENNTWLTSFRPFRSLFGWEPATERKDSENPNVDRRGPPADDQRELSCLNPDYFYCTELVGCVSRMLSRIQTILTLGLNHQIRRIVDEKRKHKRAVQIMRRLVREIAPYEFEMEVSSNASPSSKARGDQGGIDIQNISQKDLEDGSEKSGNGGNDEKDKARTMMENKLESKSMKQNEKKETPLLIAAKHGIMEMVDCILRKYPLAIHNENLDGKNIVLLAVEYRQPHVYKFLLRHEIMTETIFYKTDKDGNSALHLAARLANRRNWLIPGPALQMQWEIKWYEFVEKSKPSRFFMPCNQNGETPWQIFKEDHKDLVKEAKDWLYKTSESCSVVAVLIATVAFTASATVPGGVETNGSPVLKKQPAFNVFAIASLVALCFSIASVVMFMAFFTSRHREKDYGTNLPAKLLVELTSLLISIAAVLVSFCAAHFFVIKDTFKYTAFSLYAATLFPVALYAFWQIPMYYELVMATCRATPQRVYEHD